MIRRTTTTLLALLTAASLGVGVGAAPAHADVQPRPGTSAVPNDVPFHYSRGDHLGTDEEWPTRSSYGGRGRPIYLVGDSMAAQLADPLLRLAKEQNRALRPRTRSATQLILPAADSAAGRWSRRVFRQIKDARRPTVVLAGQYGSPTVIRKTVWRLRAYAGATVLLVTPTPRPDRDYNRCVGNALRAGRNPNITCRWRVADPGSGWWATMTAARQGGIPHLNLLSHVARGDRTHPPVVRSAMVHRHGSHVTATFARRVLTSPIRAALERAR